MFYRNKTVLNYKKKKAILLRKPFEKYSLSWFNKWSKEAEYNLLKFYFVKK